MKYPSITFKEIDIVDTIKHKIFLYKHKKYCEDIQREERKHRSLLLVEDKKNRSITAYYVPPYIKHMTTVQK